MVTFWFGIHVLVKMAGFQVYTTPSQTNPKQKLTCCYPTTRHKRVPSESRITPTQGHMIGHITCGVCPTHSRTRVNTVLVNTCLVTRTFRVDNAFRFAFNVRVADVVADACTWCSCSTFCALGVDATRAGVAGFDYFYWACSWNIQNMHVVSKLCSKNY